MKFNGKMSTIGLTLALVFGGSSVAVAATDAPAHAKSSVSKQDADYMKKLAQANMAEVAVAKIAQSKSKDEHVLAFSKQMIEDHTAGLNEVKMLADKKGVSLPAKPDKAHQEEAAKLSKLEGEKFDNAYLTNAGLKDHEAALDLAKTVSQKADDADLKALAEKMSGVISKHLQMVQKVARK
jgi:putative membrane protein